MSSRRFILKPKSLSRYFSGLFIDHHRDKGVGIDDDWEIIEVHEQEFSGAGEGDASGDGQDSDFIDLPDHLPFPSLQLPIAIKFTILSKADVRRHLEDKISLLCSIISFSRAEATILLRHFKWDLDRTQDEWLGREQKVRTAVGLFERPILDSSFTERACGICHGIFLVDMMLAVSCGHRFCRSCWTGYISKAISDGPNCLALRCPSPSCGAAVGPNMVELLSSEEDKNKFEIYLLKSYVNSCREAKWCPGPECEYALFSSGGGDSNKTITCRCLYRFCWKCTNEAHSPVDCCIVNKWMSEMGAQSENWILANTLQCPNCKIPGDLNPDFKYFERCVSCNYEFCSKCGFDRSNHEVTGEYWAYNCSLDKSSRPAGFHIGDDHKRDIAKKSLERYNLYYQRWVTTESSRANALTDLKLLQDVQLPMICQILMFPARELDFLAEAQLQIIECWQVLKWTYVYVYFLSEDECTKIPLLEFMQEQAENLVTMLHKHVEELKNLLLQEAVPLTRLLGFRRNLVQLTRVARTHFDKMETALKAGLPEVVFIPTPSARQMSRLKISQAESSSGDGSSPMLG